MRFKIILLTLLSLFGHFSLLESYDRWETQAYAKKWWKSNSSQDNYISNRDNLSPNHVNGSLQMPPGPYTWYYTSPRSSMTLSDDGSNNPSIKMKWASNCSNFVSQCLIAGGIKLPKELVSGRGGTILNCEPLGLALERISIKTKFSRPNEIPNHITIGDVIIFHKEQNSHSMIVVSGQGPDVCLAAQSNDVYGATLEQMFSDFDSATSYHIVDEKSDFNWLYKLSSRNYKIFFYPSAQSSFLNPTIQPLSNPRYTRENLIKIGVFLSSKFAILN